MPKTMLAPLEYYGLDRLVDISIPESQNQFVKFNARAAGYEMAGNPWCFAIDTDGVCTGYLFAEADSNRDLHLHKLVVSESLHGQGIGSAAIKEFIAMAKESGADTIFLSVAIGNDRAEKFYQRFGFSPAICMGEAGCRLFSLDLN